MQNMFAGLKKTKDKLSELLETAKEQANRYKKAAPKWIVAGPAKAGKSVNSAKLCYMNLKYKDKEWFPDGVKKLLKNGIIPEVTKTIVLDTENVWLQRIFKIPKVWDIFKPVLQEGSFYVIPVLVKGRRSRYDPIESRQNIEEVIDTIASAQDSEETFMLTDSLSDYYRWLNQNLMLLHGKEIVKTMRPGSDEGQALLRPFYQWRNNEWEVTVKTIREHPGHAIETAKAGFKFIKKPDGGYDYSNDEDDAYAKLAPDTEYWFDEYVWFWKDSTEDGMNERVRFEFQTGDSMRREGCAIKPSKTTGYLSPLEDKGTFLKIYDLLAEAFG